MNFNNIINLKIGEANNAKKTITIAGANTPTVADILFFDTANGRYVKFLKITKSNPIIVVSLFGAVTGQYVEVSSYIYSTDNKYVLGFTCVFTGDCKNVMWQATGIGSGSIIV